jgi:hypothetical protein
MPEKLKTMQGNAVKMVNYIKAHLSNSQIFNDLCVEWVVHMNNCTYILKAQKNTRVIQKVIGELWFPGLMLKMVLNMLQPPFNCCLFNTFLQVCIIVN